MARRNVTKTQVEVENGEEEEAVAQMVSCCFLGGKKKNYTGPKLILIVILGGKLWKWKFLKRSLVPG